MTRAAPNGSVIFPSPLLSHNRHRDSRQTAVVWRAPIGVSLRPVEVQTACHSRDVSTQPSTPSKVSVTLTVTVIDVGVSPPAAAHAIASSTPAATAARKPVESDYKDPTVALRLSASQTEVVLIRVSSSDPSVRMT